MKRNKRLNLPFITFLVVCLFFMVGSSRLLHAAEPVIEVNAANVPAAPAAAQDDLSAAPEVSAQSYYVVNDDLYLLMQKPMAKAYGAFAIVPVMVSDAAGPNATDADIAGLAPEEAGHADAGFDPESADKGRGGLQGTEIAMNLNFKGEDETKEDLAPVIEAPQENNDIADPLEPLNRVFFTFNDKFYFWALKPVASAYGFIVPEWGRTRVKNVFENIQAPIRLVNALLQLKMHKFGAEFAKFVLNSTVGIGGLFDIASRHPELKTKGEDLGQTFGSYGIGEGFYLVLPFLGPSSLRDAVGTVGDSFLDPISYITPLRDAVAVRSGDLVNDTSFKIGDYEDIKESALDPYLAIRDIYKQLRRTRVRE